MSPATPPLRALVVEAAVEQPEHGALSVLADHELAARYSGLRHQDRSPGR